MSFTASAIAASIVAFSLTSGIAAVATGMLTLFILVIIGFTVLSQMSDDWGPAQPARSSSADSSRRHNLLDRTDVLSVINRDGTLVLAERTVGLAAAISAFVMVSTAVFTITHWMGIHNVLLGATMAVLASVHALRISQDKPIIALAGVLALLGAWTTAAPFVLGVSRPLVIQINVAAGILIMILSLVSAYGILQTSRSGQTSGATGV
ncbi:hypothetical protein [Haloterrigena alkaliphila]|uniref:hypothetical protein n=1 Tax=Haloterrigena alkaliphila TaxID=2816475 RepID=UPI001CEDA1DF|nr:hypothetical protein [Haloterrigena alkaliphila]UHQ95011.1 hypothetical protein J0X25_18845 [Haloterrigena alkaliphila]